MNYSTSPSSLHSFILYAELSLSHKCLIYVLVTVALRGATKSSITLKLFSALEEKEISGERKLGNLENVLWKTTCWERRGDCWLVIPLKFTHICRAWRRLCKEDKIKAWMPHKINSAIDIRAFNQWKTSSAEQIRSQGLEGNVRSPWMIAIYLLRTMTAIFCILIATLIRSFQTLSIF